ncbi:MAG: aspartyl protease [Ignisphaera sp.]|nr:aspartyl protease [Ignisphaera sp.]
MGYVRVKAFVGDAHKRKVMEVVFLVDTGSFYPVIPPNIAKELGIEPLAKTEIVLADSRKASVDISLAFLKVLDREGIFPVIIMDSPEPLLGVVVLEGLGVRVDPVTGKLEYSRPYGLAVLSITTRSW